MKTVNYLSIFFLITCCCSSCKETGEGLCISIQNRTEDDIHITLFPKELVTEGTYLHGDVGSGAALNKFVLYPHRWRGDWNEVLFTTKNLKIEPYQLASRVFDSIYIRRVNEVDVILKFTPEKATGYSENLFSEQSAWKLEIREEADRHFFHQEVYREYVYRFLILEDKIIIE